MKKKIFGLCLIISILLLAAGCGEASDETIEAAQVKYRELVELHNQVLDEYAKIQDNSMEQGLGELATELESLTEYNLASMKEEDAQVLLENMDVMIEKYNKYQEEIKTVSKEEDAKKLTSIPVTLINNTDQVVTEIYLYQKSGKKSNLLGDEEQITANETILGLVINRDVNNTPWILEAVTSSGQEISRELEVSNYKESGETINLDEIVQETEESEEVEETEETP